MSEPPPTAAAAALAPHPTRNRLQWSPGSLLAVFLLACIALQLALIPAPRNDGLLIGSDGIEQYAYLRSVVIDHDLDFANEFAHFAKAVRTPPVGANGRTGNKHSAFGVSLLWSPFFMAAHILVLGLAAAGVAIVADGYNYVYQAAVCLGSAVYGALGCWMTFCSARRYYTERFAALALGLLWIAGNAGYYMVLEPSMPHMVSLFAVASLLTLWLLRLRDIDRPTIATFALFGVALGLVITVRTQDALFIGIPAVFIAAQLLRMVRHGRHDDVMVWLGGLALAAAIALVMVAAQLYTWQQIYGIWYQSPMQRDNLVPFRWAEPRLLDVLFSWRRGLFTWHPVLVLATAGLAWFHRRDRRLAIALAIALAAQVYVLAAWWDWWEGDAFGGRIFLNCLWLWGLGLAALLAWVADSQRRVVVATGLALLLVGWNALSLVQYRLGWFDIQNATAHDMTIGRLLVPQHLLERLQGRPLSR